MKTHRLFAVTIILSTLFLAGCVADTTQMMPETPGEKTYVQPTEDATTQPSSSEADMAAYSGAIQLKDVSFCDKIKDVTLKNSCKTEIADQAALDEALKNSDESLCAKLSTADRQEACKTSIEVSKAEEQARIEKQKEVEKSNELAKEIGLSGDISRCKEMGAEQAVRCEYFILINQAIQKNDPKICEQASESETVEKCKNYYQENIPTTGELEL